MEILHEFGIQPILLAAQVVNFFILLFILKKFLYKPILKMLELRRQKIAQSLKDTEEIEKRLAKLEEDREKTLAKAASEARDIILDASESANQIIKEAHGKAATDIEVLVARARQSMSLEREKMYLEIKKEIANLVVIGLQKVTGKILNKKDQIEMIKESMKGMI